MNKLIIILVFASMIACTDSAENTNKTDETRVEEYSGEDITPQVDYDTTSETVIDTIRSAEGADEQIDDRAD